MLAAVCQFWDNLQLEETGLHISSFRVWNDGFYNDIMVIVLYKSYGNFKLQPQYYEKRNKSLTAFFYLQRRWKVRRRPFTQKE